MTSTDTTMQALMFTAPRTLELQTLPLPEIQQPDDVLLRVRAAGICGSDLHGYTGQSGRRTPPLIMGHEVVGEVVATGQRVTDLPPGTRVAVYPLASCGTCPACQSGQPNRCPTRRLMGMDAPGGYADYVLWPAANLHPLPDTLSDAAGSLAEPLAVALHAAARAPLQPGDPVFVAGAGPIGLLLTAVLRQRGAAPILVSDLSDERLAAARTLGAHITINPREQELEATVRQHTDGQGVAAAWEAVGTSATVQQATAATRDGGTIVWVGNNQRIVEVDMQRIVTRELTLIGTYGMTRTDFQHALHFLSANHLDPTALITHHASLSEGPTLFPHLLATPSLIKCIFTPRAVE